MTSRFGGHTGHSRGLTLSGGLGQTPSYPGVSAFSPRHCGERCVVQLAGSARATQLERSCEASRAPARLPVLASGMSPLTLDEPWGLRCRVGRGVM